MTRPATVLLLAASAAFSGGCAALTNPVADGVPVRRLPAEVLGRPKSELRAVPLTLLRQQEPDAYRLDKGDVLAIVADEIIAPGNQPAPVRLPDQNNPDTSVGFPVPVDEDGTIKLPRLAPIPVKGLTLREAGEAVRDFATGKRGGVALVKPGQTRISVQLLQKRTYEVLVVREDTAATQTTIGGNTGPVFTGGKKGSGFTLRLPAYTNDVLRALNASGGPPGLDAKNEVVVLRGRYDPANPEKNTTRIPLRIFPDEPLNLKESDVVLNDGDILYIEARDAEVYYTAGIIGGGQFVLPRDYDLRVVQAIAQVRGPLLNGGFSQNAFVAQSVNTGIGTPSPSLVTVLRRLPDGRQIPIRVDLNRAFQDPRENILIQAGDVIVQQERPGEAIGRYLTQTFRFTTVIESIRSRNIQQVVTGTNP